ncbi:MAG: hypothetical protein QXK98_06265 [Candidatus Bathyarchaeia archaeon]
MSQELEVRIRAVDEASEAFERVGASARSLVLGLSGVATSAFSLYQSFDRLEKAQYAVEKANLAVKSSLKAVEDAQARYNKAVEKYGGESEEAKKAAKDLALAQERYQLVLERAEMAQENFNQTVMHVALSIVPTAITMIDSGVKAFKNFHAAVDMVNKVTAFLAANPLMAVVMAVGLVVAALITAYQTCEPFRNAVNALGEALYNFFKPAVDAVAAALNWLWNNVVKPLSDAFNWLWSNVLAPLASFLIAYFIASWKAVGDGLWWLYEHAVKPLIDALNWLWQNVLVPLGGFLTATFYASVKAVGEAANWLWTNCFKPLADGLKWLWDNILKPLADFLSNTFKPVFDAVGNVVNAVKGGIDWLANALKGLCFKHAAPMAEKFNRALKETNTLTDTATEQISSLASSLKGLPSPKLGATTGLAHVAPPVPPLAGEVKIVFEAPLVNVEGSADRRTAELAAELIEEKLKSVLVEATSSAAPTKRIRFTGIGFI